MKKTTPRRTSALAAIFFLAAAFTGATEKAPGFPPPPWPCECEPERQLKLSSPPQTGADVRGLQAYLRKLGYDPGPIDGVYGPRTAAAFGEYQRKNIAEGGALAPGLTEGAIGDSALARRQNGLKPSSGLELVVDIDLTLLIVLEGSRVVATFPVALGKVGTPTPVGNYRITHKAKWGEGFGTRWLGLDVPWGVYGIHGTNRPWTIGGYESHGCIRMFNADVERLYEMVPNGTRVHIIGNPFYGVEKLGPGDRGTPVVYLQRRLRQLQFYRGPTDGDYGVATERAVMAFQKAYRLEVTGRIGWREMHALKVWRTD